MSIGSIVGKLILNDKINHTDYFFGDIAELKNIELDVIEKTPRGDCLCLIEGRGLIDVDCKDIKLFTPIQTVDSLFNDLLNLGEMLKKC